MRHADAAPGNEPPGVKVATITVNGFVKEGTAFDPNRIAQTYWKVHKLPLTENWQVEVAFNG